MIPWVEYLDRVECCLDLSQQPRDEPPSSGASVPRHPVPPSLPGRMKREMDAEPEETA